MKTKTRYAAVHKLGKEKLVVPDRAGALRVN